MINAVEHQLGVGDCTLLDFNPIGNEQGWLVSLEEGANIPFSIKRVYYIFGTASDIKRGMHAHHNLEQVVVCVAGRCTFSVDDGVQKRVLDLNSPGKGLHIKGMIWREMTEFSSDCVLMVLASEKYDPDDYIRNYEEFAQVVKAGVV